MIGLFGMAEPRHSYIVTRTPLRLSFAGGGSDLPEFYERDFGAVFSMAIDKYIYVTVKRHGELSGERYRLNYSSTENVDDVDEIENDIARECLKTVPVDAPLYISTVGDLPAQAGLGSSSSFAVGLLNALHTMRGERVTQGQLAEEAVHVELQRLKRPMGKQDHFAAAFGGLNYIRFEAEDRVQIEPQNISHERITQILQGSLMMWTGIQRESNKILEEQRVRTSEKRSDLKFLRDQASQLRKLFLENGSLQEIGEALNQGWQKKSTLASTITTPQIDQWYAAALKAGAIGGKLCGAGGGGYLFLVVETGRKQAVIDSLSGLVPIQIAMDPHGSRALLPVEI